MGVLKIPNYSNKIRTPATPLMFKDAYNLGHYSKQDHKSFFALLFYLGVRCSEALAIKKEDFKIYPHSVFVEVKRLKKEHKNKKKKKIKIRKVNPRKYIDTLELNREWLGVEQLITVINKTKPNERVFPYCRKTGYNIVQRCFNSYPHYLRFSFITNLLMWGWNIPEIKQVTGLSLQAIEYYILMVNLKQKKQELTERYKATP